MLGPLFSDSKNIKKVVSRFDFRFKRIPVAMFAAVLSLLIAGMAIAGTDTQRSDDPPSSAESDRCKRLLLPV